MSDRETEYAFLPGWTGACKCMCGSYECDRYDELFSSEHGILGFSTRFGIYTKALRRLLHWRALTPLQRSRILRVERVQRRTIRRRRTTEER